MSNQYDPSCWGKTENLKEKIQEALKKCSGSSTKAAEFLGMSTATFYRYSKKLGIRQRRPGGRGTACLQPKFSLQDVFENKIFKCSGSVKQRLLEDGLKQDKCEICGQDPVWNNKRLILQLHHIDGNHRNNAFENLQIICPNCHTQTNTFGGKRNWHSLEDEETLLQKVKSANEKHKTLHEAAKELKMSASHFRKLLIRFGL